MALTAGKADGKSFLNWEPIPSIMASKGLDQYVATVAFYAVDWLGTTDYKRLFKEDFTFHYTSDKKNIISDAVLTANNGLLFNVRFVIQLTQDGKGAQDVQCEIYFLNKS